MLWAWQRLAQAPGQVSGPNPVELFLGVLNCTSRIAIAYRAQLCKRIEVTDNKNWKYVYSYIIIVQPMELDQKLRS